MGITSSAVGLKICSITAGIKKDNSIKKKKKKKHEKIVLLAKFKFNSIEVLISKALTDWCVSHDEFVTVNDALKEYDDRKEANQKPKEFKSKSNILIYLKNNVILLFKV